MESDFGLCSFLVLYFTPFSFNALCCLRYSSRGDKWGPYIKAFIFYDILLLTPVGIIYQYFHLCLELNQNIGAVWKKNLTTQNAGLMSLLEVFEIIPQLAIQTQAWRAGEAKNTLYYNYR
eukprot:UN06045